MKIQNRQVSTAPEREPHERVQGLPDTLLARSGWARWRRCGDRLSDGAAGKGREGLGAVGKERVDEWCWGEWWWVVLARNHEKLKLRK